MAFDDIHLNAGTAVYTLCLTLLRGVPETKFVWKKKQTVSTRATAEQPRLGRIRRFLLVIKIVEGDNST